MSTQTLSPRSFGRSLRQTLRAPIRLQTYRNLLYLALMFPLGWMYFMILTMGFSLGVGLSFVIIGIPLLILTIVLSVGLAALERTLARVLLRVEIPTASVDTDQTIWDWTKQLVTDRRTWTAVAYLLTEFFVGTVVFTFLSSLLATGVSLLLTPLYYTHIQTGIYVGPAAVIEFTPEILFGWNDLLIGLRTTIQIDAFQIASISSALVVAVVGAAFLIISLQLFNCFAWLWGRYMRSMLTVPRYWTGLAR
jgi:hypothetical protein